MLALDVGSSSVRAALYDAGARALEETRAVVRRAFDVPEDGAAEADAEALLADVLAVIDATLSRAPSGADVAAIAVACFWHSLLGLDDAGRAATPVIGWADTRAGAQAEALRRRFDERATHARTGCRFHPSYWPAKLLWLRESRPDLWPRVSRWLSFGEFLTLRLCGRTAVSVSMASGTGLFNQRACGWDEELLRDLELDPSTLPQIAGDAETFALKREWAERWPSLRNAAFFPAMGDGAANNVGEGCVSRARVALMVGTSGAMRVVYEGAPPREMDAGLWCYRLDRRRACVGGALSDGGGTYAWLRGALNLKVAGDRAGMVACGRADESIDERVDERLDGSPDESAAAGLAALMVDEDVEREASLVAPDGHDLTVLPFWGGERSTGWHSYASGAILGLTLKTRPAEIVRATLEAIAYRFAFVARALDAHAPGAEVRASGGALRESALWAQVLADVLGRPVVLSGVREASSRGAVLLALEASGAIKSVADVAAPVGATCEPDEARHAVYQAGIERHRRIYELLVGDQRTARLLARAEDNARGR